MSDRKWARGGDEVGAEGGESPNEQRLETAASAGRAAGGLDGHSRDFSSERRNRRSGSQGSREPTGEWAPARTDSGPPFHAPQAHVLEGTRPAPHRSRLGAHGPCVASRSNRGPRASRISPCSFRFLCRSLRFRFSIFLRRSFIGR